jgi:hypothetical protein
MPRLICGAACRLVEGSTLLDPGAKHAKPSQAKGPRQTHRKPPQLDFGKSPNPIG